MCFGLFSAIPYSRVLKPMFGWQFTESWRDTDFFSHMPKAQVQRSTTPANPQVLIIHVGSPSDKLIIAICLTWTWFTICWSLGQIWVHKTGSTCEVVTGSLCRSENGKRGVGWPICNVVKWRDDVFNGALLVHLIGNEMTEGNFG